MAVYEFGKFQLDADRLLLYHDQVAIGIGPKVVETLLALLEKPDTIQAKKGLIDRIWPEGYVEEANLVQNIYVLRKVLRSHGHPAAIETASRRGYRFTLPVRRLDDAFIAQPRSGRLGRLVVGVATAAALALVVASGYALSGESYANVVRLPESRLDRIGDFFLSRRTPYGIRRSILFFSRAVAQRPTDAFSFGSRAQAYALEAENAAGSISHQVHDRLLAGDDAHRALNIDPRSGRAYAALGLLALDSGRDDAALDDLGKAVAFSPSNSNAHEWYGIALLRKGCVAGAERQLTLAEQLDPLSIAATAWLSAVSYLDRRYDEAVTYARVGLSMAPERRTLWVTLGLAQEAEGQYPSAIDSFERYGQSCSQCKGEEAALLADAYAQLHLPQRARAELAVAQAAPQGVRPEDLALALAAVDAPSRVRLPEMMSSTDRLILANDPRIDRLSSRERLRLLSGQG
jgi:DNA-binding winged helix-turn-helix (wHTH) protein/Flp pilus assembly protein TadD